MECSPYHNPMYPTGSIVLVEKPTTHNDMYETISTIGLVYESYMHKGYRMYAVLMKNNFAFYDMKYFKASTSSLSSDICCQHLDENRIKALKTDT